MSGGAAVTGRKTFGVVRAGGGVQRSRLHGPAFSARSNAKGLALTARGPQAPIRRGAAGPDTNVGRKP